MREQITIVIIGALVGLFPTLLATLIKWLDKRSLTARQNRALGLAQQRVEYLDNWVKVQETLCSPEQFDEIKQEVSNELVQINRTLRENLVEEEDEFVTFEERNVLQRVFLLYTPRSVPGWVFHIIFYVFLGILSVWLISGLEMSWTRGRSIAYVIGSLIGQLGILSPLVVLIFLFRWFAVRSDRAAEERIEAQHESKTVGGQ